MSELTLRNTTPYIAQFVVNKGSLVVARIPGLGPNAVLQVPLEETYEVTATTIIDGNTYTTAPIALSGAMSFTAEVLQEQAQGTYVFHLRASPSTVSNQLQFQKTSLNPVTFTISRYSVALQHVVVSDSFMAQSIDIGDEYHIYAIINGITTATVNTGNLNAVVTAVVDTSTINSGYFTLTVG